MNASMTLDGDNFSEESAVLDLGRISLEKLADRPGSALVVWLRTVLERSADEGAEFTSFGDRI